MVSEKLTGWQPIETAPKDGTEFLALASNGWYVLASAPAEAIKEGWPYAWWRTSGGTRYPVVETHPANSLSDTGLLLTHWQPLPAPPGTTRAPADLRSALEAETACERLQKAWDSQDDLPPIIFTDEEAAALYAALAPTKEPAA